MERRFLLGDWEPATLDGGQFAEVAARIVYHVDSGNLNRTKAVDACLKYIEDPTNSNAHAFPSQRAARHLCKVLRTIYKFRSQRGAVHIDPNYTSNELDATFLIMSVRWVMAEILRVFWTGHTADVAKAIQEITRFDVPAIMNMDGRLLMLRTDCTVEEEILILLHNVGHKGMTRTELGKAIPKSPSSVSRALSRLTAATKREVIQRADGCYVLTANGIRRIKEELAAKLQLS